MDQQKLIENLGVNLSKVDIFQTSTRVKDPAAFEVNIEHFKNNELARSTTLNSPFAEVTAADLPGINSALDNLRAAILTEESGMVDQKLARMSHVEKHTFLYQQIDNSAEALIRATQFAKANQEHLGEMSPAEIYSALLSATFETTDMESIKSNYVLAQRKSLLLGITNFIDDTIQVKPYLDELDQDPHAFFLRYLNADLNPGFTVHKLPSGIVLHLDAENYKKYDPLNDLSANPAAAVTTFSSRLPPILRGRMIIVNTESSIDTDIATDHEIRHLVFHSFFSERAPVSIASLRYDLAKCKSLEDFNDLAAVFEASAHTYARNELISYFHQGYERIRLSSLGFSPIDFSMFMKSLGDKMDFEVQFLNDPEKRAVQTIFMAAFLRSFDRIKEEMFIADNLKLQVARGKLSEEKAEALLRVTRGTKIHRLAEFAGLESADLKPQIETKNQLVLQELQAVIESPESIKQERQQYLTNLLNYLDRFSPIGTDKLVQQLITTKLTPETQEITELRNKLPSLGDVIYRYKVLHPYSQPEEQNFSK